MLQVKILKLKHVTSLKTNTHTHGRIGLIPVNELEDKA